MITIPYKNQLMIFTKEEWKILKAEFQELSINWDDKNWKNDLLDILLFNK